MAAHTQSTRPANFVVFTLGIVGEGGALADQPTSTGRAHAAARGFLLTAKKDQPSPFFDLKVYSTDGKVSALVQRVADLKPKQRVTVKGRLGYRKYEGNSGMREKLEVVVSEVDVFDPKAGKSSDFVMLTLKAVQDGGVMDFTSTGKARAKVSAMLSTGKDATGAYKPPFFVEVAHVSKDDQPTPLMQAIAQLKKGDFFTVKGGFRMSEWESQEGTKRHGFSIWANSIEPFHWEGTSELHDEPELEGEPA